MNVAINSVFIRVFYNDDDLSANVESLKYEYNEESDDEISLELSSYDRNLPDRPEFQPNAQLKIIWGYIKGKTSEIRKAYVQDVKWKFADDGVKGTITLGEKAISMKSETSNKVWKNTNLLDMIDQMSKKHGLNPVYDEYQEAIESDDIQLIKKKFGDTDAYQYVKKLRRTPFAGGEIPKKTLVAADLVNAGKQNQQTWDEIKQLYGSDPDPAVVQSYFKAKKSFSGLNKTLKAYASIPQGGKSDKQLLNETLRQEPGGPYIAETRDDNLTIKRRNFAQPAYRSFEFGGSDGELLEFVPESKNKVKKGASDNLSFGGWDSAGKNFYQGNANILNDPNINVLSKWRAIYNALAKRDPDAKFDEFLTGANIRLAASTSTKNQTVDGDNTAVVLKAWNKNIVSNKQAKDKLGQILDTYAKNITDPRQQDPANAFGMASGLRNAAELNRNPASARVIMDPGLKSGMLITIVNVSKKYSGNYYIIKANHLVAKSGYAYTELEMVTQGNNAKAGKNFLPSDKLHHNVNKSIGPLRAKNNTRKVIVKTK